MTHTASAAGSIGLHGSPSPTPASARRASWVERYSWALYDFANTIWSMNVTSLYFTGWLVADLGSSNSAVAWGTAVSSILMALSAPVFGAISDDRRRRKPWVVWFTILSCVATAAIGWIGIHGGVPLYGESVVGGTARPENYHITGTPLVMIVIAFTVASYCYQAAQPFYNAMLPELVPPEELGRLSGIGTAVGYIGTIFGLLLVAPFFDGSLPLIGKVSEGAMRVLHSIVPTTSTGGRVATFVPTAMLFLLFSLPIFLFYHDRNPAPKGAKVDWRRAFAEVRQTIRDARQHPGTLRFIIASLIYQDATGTITFALGLYAIQAVGFTQSEVSKLYIILTVPTIVGSYVCGRLVDRVGAKKTLVGVLVGWSVLLVTMAFFPGKPAFWAIGATIGLIFGGVPAAERPLLLSLVPEKEAGRFFSLLLLSSRAGSFLGPVVWAITVDYLQPRFGNGVAYRAALLTVAVFFGASLIVLRGVPNKRGKAALATV
jgi:UMF1 family MFS transporter